MKTKLLLIFCIVCFCLTGETCFDSANAEERLALKTKDLVVIYDPPFQSLAEYLQENYSQVRNDIEQILGWKLESPPVVVLVGKSEAFEKMSGSPHFSAYAVPRRNLIVIHCSPLNSQPYLLGEIFKHELCHLFLHQHIPDSRLPKWLDEGICQWVSGNLGEIVVNQRLTNRMEQLHRLIPLNQLDQSFPRKRQLLFLAYEESRRFVKFIVDQYGKEALLATLEYLKEGKSIDQSIEESTGKSLEKLEEEWLKEVTGKRMWFIWISQYLYEFVFLMGAFLVVCASIRLMIKKRRYEDEDEDEEGGEKEREECGMDQEKLVSLDAYRNKKNVMNRHGD